MEIVPSLNEIFRVVITNQLTDNYAYVVIDPATKECAVVDVSQYEPIIKVIEDMNVKCTAILTTHHHADHCGGNLELLKNLEGCKVYGGDQRIPGLTNPVRHGDTIQLGNLVVKCYFTPCHTSGHVLFEVIGKEKNALFTGDTLFLAGCGKFFEGSAHQMNYALNNVVAGLADNTEVWCGHEYSVTNLAFAMSVDPDNEILQNKYKWATQQRAKFLPTIPSSVGDEKSYNPFMRVSEKVIKMAVGDVGDSDDDTMLKLREAKNNFHMPSRI